MKDPEFCSTIEVYPALNRSNMSTTPFKVWPYLAPKPPKRLRLEPKTQAGRHTYLLLEKLKKITQFFLSSFNNRMGRGVVGPGSIWGRVQSVGSDHWVKSTLSWKPSPRSALLFAFNLIYNFVILTLFLPFT